MCNKLQRFALDVITGAYRSSPIKALEEHREAYFGIKLTPAGPIRLHKMRSTFIRVLAWFYNVRDRSIGRLTLI